MDDKTALERLSSLTFAVEHNPNCPSPFLVRLVRKGAGRLDEVHDIKGYGSTLGEAALDALLTKGSEK